MSVETLKGIEFCCSENSGKPRETAVVRLGVMARNLAVRFWHSLERSRSRRHLANLDDRLLCDIGLSRDKVEREMKKPFWVS